MAETDHVVRSMPGFASFASEGLSIVDHTRLARLRTIVLFKSTLAGHGLPIIAYPRVTRAHEFHPDLNMPTRRFR